MLLDQQEHTWFKVFFKFRFFLLLLLIFVIEMSALTRIRHLLCTNTTPRLKVPFRQYLIDVVTVALVHQLLVSWSKTSPNKCWSLHMSSCFYQISYVTNSVITVILCTSLCLIQSLFLLLFSIFFLILSPSLFSLFYT